MRDFVRESVDVDERESLLLRESDGGLEMALVVPSRAANDHDGWLQLAEGVSHFVYVANRARQELPSTQLELELQAEVDKFVLLVLERVPYDRGDAFEHELPHARHALHAVERRQVRHLERVDAPQVFERDRLLVTSKPLLPQTLGERGIRLVQIADGTHHLSGLLGAVAGTSSSVRTAAKHG